jgi:predicted nuclease with TOPRIM domain
MEKHFDSAVGQITEMRRELADMREMKNHPIKNALQKTVDTLKSKLDDAIERLKELKSAIISGAKKALTAIKETGQAALSGIMSFFHIKDGLQAVNKSLEGGVQETEKAMAKIDAFSKSYHEAGNGLKNMGRALLGKEAVTDVKAAGNLAKAIKAPYKAERACVVKIRKAVKAAIAKIDALDTTVQTRRENKATKRSVMERLDEKKERVVLDSRDKPAPVRAKAQEALG